MKKISPEKVLKFSGLKTSDTLGCINHGLKEQRNLILHNVFPTSLLQPDGDPPPNPDGKLNQRWQHSRTFTQYHLYIFHHWGLQEG